MTPHRLVLAGLLATLVAGCQQLSSQDPDLRVADVELANGAPEAALRVAQSLVAQRPADAKALIRLGQAQAALARPTAAADSFRRALRSDPDSVEAQLGLARLELTQDADKALAILQPLAGRRSDDARVLTDLGIAYDLKGQPAAAQAVYRQALALHPDLVSAQVDLGLSLALSGHTAEAMTLLAPLAQAPEATARIRQDFAAAAAMAGREDVAREAMSLDLPRDQVATAMNAFNVLGHGQP